MKHTEAFKNYKRYNPAKFEELRAKAIAKLDQVIADVPAAVTAKVLLHELHVHQIELEMQNEELQDANQKLELMRNRYLDLYEFSPVGFMTLADDNFISVCNLKVCSLLGMERRALLHSRFAILIADDDKDRWYQFSRDMKKSPQGEEKSIDLVVKRSNGTSFYARLNCLRLEDITDTPDSLQLVMTDVSQEKQTEEQVEERLSLAVHATGIGIWDWNLQTMEMVWDDSMFELYHIKREDFSNAVNAWEKSLHPEDRQRAEHEIEEALNNIKPFNSEFRIVWPNGEVRYIKAVAKVFFSVEGKPLSMLGTNIDITERSLVDRMKSEFIATAAHELRTPMTMIFGYAELLNTMDIDAETQKELIATIYAQSKAMINLLSEVLDMAKMEAQASGFYQMTPQPIGTILKVLADTLVTPDNRNKVVLEINPNLPDVNVDKTKIEQAVRNLLSNAFKFSPNHEPISMQVTEVMQNQQRKVLIAIKDHGIGMTPEQLKHVYERFYRVDQSGNVPGTGLGMAIVQEIITHHGGTIEIESKLGAGTKVMVYLPVAS